MITLEEFRRIELRIAEIRAAERVAGAAPALLTVNRPVPNGTAVQ